MSRSNISKVTLLVQDNYQPRVLTNPLFTGTQHKQVYVSSCGTIIPEGVLAFIWDEALEGILEHGKSDPTREVGGWLIGTHATDILSEFVIIKAWFPAVQGKASAVSFKFTHEDQMALGAAMTSRYHDLQILGWYHSHPLGLELSEDDKQVHRGVFNKPYHIALVMMSGGAQVGCAGWRDGLISEVGGFFILSRQRSGIGKSRPFCQRGEWSIGMHKRDDRLRWEYDHLLAYMATLPRDNKGKPLVEITETQGDPPTRYRLLYNCRGLVPVGRDGSLAIAINHEVEIALGAGYPAEPPYVHVLNPIFHPNIGDGTHGGFVCLDRDYSPEMTIAEIARSLGEMIRLAHYWSTASTQNVYNRLQQERSNLPIDARVFPLVEGANPPLFRPDIKIEIPTLGSALTVTSPGNMGFAQIAKQVAERQGLPLQTPENQNLIYALRRPKNQTDDIPVYVLESIVGAAASSTSMSIDDLVAFLESAREANQDVFAFESSLIETQEHRFLITFDFELFAPALGAWGKPQYVRRRNNQAYLYVSHEQGISYCSLTWLTPIFHPNLTQYYRFYHPDPGKRSDPKALFQLLSAMLDYRDTPELEIINTEAKTWIQANHARVQALLASTTRFVMQ